MPAEIRALPQFIAMKPTAHGGYFLLMDGNVVLIVPQGTWGMRCTNNYIEDVSALVKQSDVEQFGALVVFEEWQLATPDAINMLKTFNERASQEFGMQAECFVGKSNSTPIKVAERQIAPNHTGLEIVDCFQKALDWFIDKGFEFSQALLNHAYSHRHALLAESKR